MMRKAARVNFVTALYKRFQQLIHEGAKFLVVGGTGAVVTLGGADILHNHVHAGKYTAITVATVVATVVTFVGNRFWTFRHRSGKGSAHEGAMFFLLNAVGLLIGYAFIWLIQSGFGLAGAVWYDFANFLGLVFGTLFRFWSYRKWVWHAPAGGQLPAARYAQVQQPQLQPARSAPGYSAGRQLEEPPTVNLGLAANGQLRRPPEPTSGQHPDGQRRAR